MRNIKITKNNIEFKPLEDVPEDFKFIESIAKLYARTNEELKEFYFVSCKAASALKNQSSPDFYKENLLWTIRQTIIAEAKKKTK